jgi:hypothetical protein|tara:strand:- start:33 stop:419 length:387 start_codon:yes stop_codon:yes gene_type:complete
MFDPFYESEYLGRVLYLEDLKDLNRSDYLLLESELNLAIEKMKKTKQVDWDAADTDLLSKINLKLRVCEKFLKRISQVREHDLLRIDEYHLVFLRQRLANHLGPMAADKMMNEARQDAFRQLNKESNS